MDREAIQGIRTTKRLDEKLLAYKGVIGVDVDYKQHNRLCQEKDFPGRAVG